MPTDNPRLVLVHGWGSSCATWDRHEKLWPSDWVVDAIDLPGHGKNTGSRPWTVSSAVDSVVSLLRAGESPAIVVGHSLGGQITTLLHTRNPELITAEVVIDPAYGHPDQELDHLRQRSMAIEERGHSEVLEFVEGAFTSSTLERDRRIIRRDVLRTPPTALASYFDSTYLTADAIGLKSRTVPILRQRTRPTIGFYSNLTGERFEAQSGTPRTELWDECGHYLHLEQPRRFVETVTEWVSAL